MPETNALDSLEKHFRRSRRDYAKRKRIAESRVAVWRWAPKPFWNINPLHFELRGESPGKALTKEPINKVGKYCFGLDEEGRVVVERQYNHLGALETFYDWEKTPVETAHYYGYRDGEPINLHWATFVDNRLSLLVRTATGGAGIERYHWDGERLISISIEHAFRDGPTLGSLKPIKTIRAAYASDGTPQNIWIDWLPVDDFKGSTEHLFRKRDHPVELDLRQYIAPIRRTIVKAASRYLALHQKNPAKNPPVARFELIYSLGDSQSSPWMFVNIDTKNGSEPGDGPSHPNIGKLLLTKWLPIVQAVCDDVKVPVTLPDGSMVKAGDRKLGDVIGQFLVSQLLLARDEGVFQELPRWDRCELGVEDPTTMAFRWPKYKDRGKKNLI